MEAARRAGVREGSARTLAQSMALLIGAGLVAVGILGFVFGGSDFDAGGNVQGEDFIIFEVNGWHNVVHLATGALLLVMAGTARSAVAALLLFAVIYAAVTVYGFVDGNDIVQLAATDQEDNWLHAALTAIALLVALVAGSLGASALRARPQAPGPGPEPGPPGPGPTGPGPR